MTNAVAIKTDTQRLAAPRKRRWPRFSLRTLLVLTTIVCVWLGWLMVQVERQRQAVRTLAKYQPELTYNPFTSFPSWYRVLPRSFVEFVAERMPDDFQRLTQVTIDSPDLRPEDLAVLEGLPHLRYLNLTGPAITDECMTHVAKLKHLDCLKFLDTKVTDDGLRELAKLTNLRTLLLSGTTQITDAGVAHLTSLDQLETLWLDHSAVTGACINSLIEMNSIREVRFKDTGVCGPELARLALLPKLEIADFVRTPISDADLPYLLKIPTRVRFFLFGTKMSDGARSKLPNVMFPPAGSATATTATTAAGSSSDTDESAAAEK